MKGGVIDIALGGGRSQFLPEGTKDEEGKDGLRKDGRNLIEEAMALGAGYVAGDSGFKALAWGNKPVLGLFEGSRMKYEHDHAGEPSLAEMTEAAIKSLSANDQGFHLNVEGGRVDHANHDGNVRRTLTDGVAFQDAIQKAIEMTNPEDTLIVVAADHEHAIAFRPLRPWHADRRTVHEGGRGRREAPRRAGDGADGKPHSVVGLLNGAGSVLVEASWPHP